MGILLYATAVLGVILALLVIFLGGWYWLHAVPVAKYYKKRKQELAWLEPKIIVISSGPPQKAL